MSFSIKLILQELVRRAWIIVLCAVIGFVGAFVYSKNMTTPIYSTSMKVTTLANLKTVTQMETAGNYINHLTLSQRRVATYLELMKTTSFYEQVAQASGTGYTAGAVGSMLSFAPVEDMGFYYVKVVGVDPNAVKAVADAVAQEMFPYIDSIQPDTAITVIEPPKYPAGPNNKVHKEMGVKGALVGALLVIAIVAAIAYFDTHIKDEETLAQHYDIPILGSIPDFTVVTNKRK